MILPETFYSEALQRVLEEREAQVMEHGYSYEHDDSHGNDELAALACFYCMPQGAREWDASSTGYGDTLGKAILPQDWSAREREDRVHELAIAGALILAEMARLLRAQHAPTQLQDSEGSSDRD